LKRPLLGAWTWKSDIIALFVLGVLLTLFYAPYLLLAWIILFSVAFVVAHLVWLDIRITLDEELTARLTEEARTRGITFRQAVEELIRKHVKKEE
jgi:hypothetical protein